MTYKRPESVLVVLYNEHSQVLVMQRNDDPDFWQSVTGTIEADEFKRVFLSVGMNPKRKYSLVHLAELPSSGKHSATVYPYWEVKAFSVLKDQGFRSQLRCSIKRQWSSCWKTF